MEDFVSFEIAKKLKEKGFKEKVIKYYGKHENIFDCHPPLDMNDADYRCSAPTISQVLKWLREEKGIHVCIALGEFSDWMYDVSRIDGNMFCEAEDGFESYVQAALAGIEYVLDNLI